MRSGCIYRVRSLQHPGKRNGRGHHGPPLVTPLCGPFIGYLPDAENFAARGYAATLVPRILQMPPYSPALGDALVTGALALLESLES
jgi:hypothetical protein